MELFTIATDGCGNLIATDSEGAELARIAINPGGVSENMATVMAAKELAGRAVSELNERD